MEHRLTKRSNREWITALRGEQVGGHTAVAELTAYLRRVLARILGRRDDVGPDDVNDLAQEALLRVVQTMDSFRGDSAFTTWATSVATRTAFTELRRRRVRATVQADFEAVEHDALARADGDPAIDVGSSPPAWVEALERAIESRLTERQRVVILAELRGLPTIAIAEQLGTNQNALYKLAHDARKKLRASLLADGFTAEEIHEYAGDGRSVR